MEKYGLDNFKEDELDFIMDSLNLDNQCNIDIKNEKKNRKNNSNEKNSCQFCGSFNICHDTTKNVLSCKDCGIINETYLDKNPDFNNDEDKSKSYGSTTNYFFPLASLGTKIKTKGYNKLASIHNQGQMPYKERSLLGVLEKIQGNCKDKKLTQTIIDNSKILYKKINDCKHDKGKQKGKNIIIRCINRQSLIAACVYYGCKFQGEPRSPKEISEIFFLDIKHVNRGIRKFGDMINLNSYEIKNSSCSDFIERFSKKMNINKEFIDMAKFFSENIHKLNIASTHEPPSVAAACILLVSNMYEDIEINKKQISDIFDISDVTISKTYRKIEPYINIINNTEITNKIFETMNNSTSNNKLNIVKNNSDKQNDDENSKNISEDNENEISIESSIEIPKEKKVKKTKTKTKTKNNVITAN